ncbi:hypothetical protein [uncultured Lutibacter sp.]|uniref:hypothetical protein n=1 Tax=uncultured Lutibacter sp. TaxID=437739 RepID=UPI00261E07C1|nr:hypothetical protein [uncultured Lutibacter sp.]
MISKSLIVSKFTYIVAPIKSFVIKSSTSTTSSLKYNFTSVLTDFENLLFFLEIKKSAVTYLSI